MIVDKRLNLSQGQRRKISKEKFARKKSPKLAQSVHNLSSEPGHCAGLSGLSAV